MREEDLGMPKEAGKGPLFAGNGMGNGRKMERRIVGGKDHKKIMCWVRKC